MKKINLSFFTRYYFYTGAVISGIIITAISLLEIFEPTKPYNFIICASILGIMISIVIDNNVERKKKESKESKEKQERENKKNQHFPKSYPIVNDEISTKFTDKSNSENYKETNNKIDKTIKSPLEYTRETLNGNQAPIFNPNENYLEEIYCEELSHIVAITAENPNLWLDPTLCFYMINCCAVSLINKVNGNSQEVVKLKINDFNNDSGYSNFVKRESDDILQKLKEKKDLDSFDFIRFLLFNEEQKECLKNTVFPSLKASQDLFRIKSFFIQNDNIKENLKGRYPVYLAFIEDIWDRIKEVHKSQDSQFHEIIEKRKIEHIPEFLILFKKDKSVIIHTYINGKPYRTLLNNHTKGVHTDYEAIQTLIAFLADCRIENKLCDWYPKVEDGNLNTKKSYIDWN